MKLFSAQIYQARRQGLMKEVGQGCILLLGNGESPMNYTDNVYRFRQDSSFLYFLGLDLPQLAALIDIESGKTILFGDDPSLDMIVWTGPQTSLQDLAVQTGIEEVKSWKELSNEIWLRKEKGQKIHHLPPYRGENKILLQALLGISLDQLAAEASLPLIQSVVKLRSVKGQEEIAELEEAVSITSAMHLQAMQMARVGLTEAEIAAAVRHTALKFGSDLSFPIICSIHGEILHNHHYHHTLEPGRLLLVDAGGESGMHYAGDMTRTFPVDGKFSVQQKEVYQIVLDAENAAIDKLAPGVLYQEVHLEAARVITNGLKQLGLMKGDTEEAVQAGAHALFFPHGLGHMMGLDVHDMEDLGEDHVGYDESVSRSTLFGTRSLRLGRALQTHFVLTVEPGIYFIPALMDRWQAEGKAEAFINYDKLASYRSFGGIRIEEDYLITESGSRLLGSPLPKSVEEVEAVRAASLA